MPDQPAKLPPDLQKRSDVATVQEAEAKARKATVEASDAEAASSLNKLKAALGEPAPGPFSGDVTLADGAALSEANALARTELVSLAADIAGKVATTIGERTVVYLTAADGPPDLSHDSALTLRMALVANTADEARRLSDDALNDSVDARSLTFAPIAAAGLVLSGVSALLGYFKTDFKIGGEQVTVSDRDLAILIGSALVANSATVLIDGFPPAPGQELADAVQSSLSNLSTKVTTLRGRIAVHDAQLAALDQAAATPPTGAGAENGDQSQNQQSDSSQQTDTGPARAANEQAKAACAAAITLYDALITSLEADAGGISFLERALRERRLRATLGDKAALVSLKIDGGWATHIVRKNILSGLFGNLPVRVSATVGASWAAYDFDSGKLLGGGVETKRSELTDIADIKAG